MNVLRSAIDEILDITLKALLENDVVLATEVEPIEEVVDELRDTIKLNHVIRLQKSECTIEHGFVLSDLLNNFERVSDHCSNIAACVIEISKVGVMDMHKYSNEVADSFEFKQKLVYYQQKYSL
jgi:phosphate:Na+ symporter